MNIQSVLVVEDSEEDQFLNTVVIGEFDPAITVHQAYNGQEALDMIAEGLSVDLILLDINMPLLDGFGFLDEYSAGSDGKTQSVVVMLTSSGQSGDIKRAKTYACVRRYVLKPLTLETMKELSDDI